MVDDEVGCEGVGKVKGVARILEKGGANLLVYDYITRAKKVIPRNPLIYYKRERLQ